MCSPRLHRAVDSYKTRVLGCEVYIHGDYALQHACGDQNVASRYIVGFTYGASSPCRHGCPSVVSSPPLREDVSS